jgi:hypothetical protein
MGKYHDGEKIFYKVDHAAHDDPHESVKQKRYPEMVRIFFCLTLPPVHVNPALVHQQFGFHDHHHAVEIDPASV